jgi:hypothetical protein
LTGAPTSPPTETNSPTTEKERFEALGPAVRKAYFAFELAQSKNEKKLLDREAYEWFNENGIPGDLGAQGELAEYELPVLDTFTRYLREAREALGEQKYTPRGGRAHGRSIVKSKEVQAPRPDDD